MDIRNFFAFEKKKIILPLILIILLTFTLAIDALYAEKLKSDTKEAVDYNLEVLKFVVYNTTLNGTDASIENELIRLYNKRDEIEKNIISIFSSMAASYVPEYIMNTFGTNFCDLNIVLNYKNECKMTEFDSIVPSEILRLTFCAAQFTGTIGDNKTEYGYILLLGTLEDKRNFILSERGQNIYEEFEVCKYSGNFMLDEKKLAVFASYNSLSLPFIGNVGEVPKISLLNTADVVFYVIILFVVGYLVSCFALYFHRRNKALEGQGKKAYAIIFIAAVLIFGLFLWARVIKQFNLAALISLVIAYLLVTYLYMRSGNAKLTKRIGNYRKRTKK